MMPSEGGRSLLYGKRLFRIRLPELGDSSGVIGCEMDFVFKTTGSDQSCSQCSFACSLCIYMCRGCLLTFSGLEGGVKLCC